jgi:hypothetical protein
LDTDERRAKMALLTVDSEGTEDFRSKPRWSAGRKVDVVLRQLRGEKLEVLSRELGVEAHRAAWRDESLAGERDVLKGTRATTEEDRRRREGRVSLHAAKGHPAAPSPQYKDG